VSNAGAPIAALVVPEPEAYVSREQLADLMGISTKTIDRLRARGMQSVTWGRRTRRFKPSVAIAWARAQESGRLAG